VTLRNQLIQEKHAELVCEVEALVEVHCRTQSGVAPTSI
jgi:hypothetical protein